MSDLIESVRSTLDSLKRVSQNGIEHWTARDLQGPLGYARWENFEDVVKKAMKSCESVGDDPNNHFRLTAKKVAIGSGADRERRDYDVSRYAAYLIAMNGSPKLPEIAAAQSYFAVQTRRQEVSDEFGDNIARRLALRERVIEANKELGDAARDAGVQKYALFHDAGYYGLYGMRLRSIKERKGLKAGESLLDRAGRTELAANEFRITQTLDTLEREQIEGDVKAREVHRQVGAIVRNTIKEIGGTMPEDLSPEPSIKKIAAQVEKEKQLEQKKDTDK